MPEQYTDEIIIIDEQIIQAGTFGGGIIDPSKLMNDALNGEISLTPSGIIAVILKELLAALTGNAGLILVILSIALISAYSFMISSQRNSLAETENTASGIITAVFVAGFFSQAVAFASNAATGMESVALAVLPLLASLGLSNGSTVFVLTAQYVSLAVCYIFIPTVVLYGALGLAEILTDKFPIRELRMGIKSFFLWGLGLTMTVFSCVTAITGAVVSQFAGVMGRTVKYAGNLIPFVGAYLSESADLVFSGINTVRGAAGIGCSAAVFVTGISPFLKLFAFVIVLRITAFLIRPFAGSGMRGAVENTAEAITMLMAMVALMGAFFIINIAVFASIDFGR